MNIVANNNIKDVDIDCLCGLVVRVLGYRYGGPGSIPGTTRFSGGGGGGGGKKKKLWGWSGDHTPTVEHLMSNFKENERNV
jgi:hypothetical protein